MERTTPLKMEEALNSLYPAHAADDDDDNKRYIREMRAALRDQECGQFKVQLFRTFTSFRITLIKLQLILVRCLNNPETIFKKPVSTCLA
jgi:hypothetical protein